MEGQSFSAAGQFASLWGQLLLPRDCPIKVGGIGDRWAENQELKYKGAGYVEVAASGRPKAPEYLVVLRACVGEPVALKCRLVEQGTQAGVELEYANRTYAVMFNRTGAVGGRIKITSGGKTVMDHALAQDVRDTYANWKNDPMYGKWMKEDRFKRYLSDADRKERGR